MRYYWMLALLAIACTPAEPGTIQTHFCAEEPCEDLLIAYLVASEDARCAFYDLGLEDTIRALEEHAQTIIYEGNAQGLPRSFTRVSSKGSMHHKFCILDEQVVITGSMNPTQRGAYENDNVLLAIASETIARHYLQEWESVRESNKYHTRAPAVLLDNTPLEVCFSPQDSCEQKVATLVSEASESIRFMTFSYTSDTIGARMLKKHSEGVVVEGVFERRQQSAHSQYERLKKAMVDVVFDENPATMHHKTIIIDEETVITGSMNPTRNGNERNDENTIIIHDDEIAKKFLREYDRIKKARVSS